MSARWLKLTVAYDGRAYAGWQIQPDKPTVQGTFQDTWRKLTLESVNVTASGRTDAGVHALGQVVGVFTSTRLTNTELLRGLNALLPEDIAAVAVEVAPENFHATYDAIGKRYRYMIHNARTPSVFDRHYAWHNPHPLDAAAMHIAAQSLVGCHDFAAFETAGSERPDSIRTIHELTVERGLAASLRDAQTEHSMIRSHHDSSNLVMIEVAGDGFLYNMVRTIVGTLVEVGRGNRDTNWPAEVLTTRDRRRAGQTAPPQGLFLVSVDYAT